MRTDDAARYSVEILLDGVPLCHVTGLSVDLWLVVGDDGRCLPAWPVARPLAELGRDCAAAALAAVGRA